jgi:general secretion pathway protein A
MYTEYFGFREKPFNITSDPSIFYTNSTYQRAYANLLYGVCERKGLTVLTGEVGTGKTTLLRRLIQNLENTVHFVFFYYTTQTFDDLLDFILNDLGVSGQAEGYMQKIEVLKAFLIEQLREGQPIALLIDEVQNLDAYTLMQLDLLVDLQIGGEKLLPTVLAGQPEFEAKLAEPVQVDLRRQVTLHCRLDCLKEREVGAFIQYRLRAVGCERRDLFSAEAVKRIARYTKRIPRLINVLCDNALLLAYKTGQTAVSATIVEEVAQGLHLQEEGPVLQKVTWQNEPLGHQSIARVESPMVVQESKRDGEQLHQTVEDLRVQYRRQHRQLQRHHLWQRLLSRLRPHLPWIAGGLSFALLLFIFLPGGSREGELQSPLGPPSYAQEGERENLDPLVTPQDVQKDSKTSEKPKARRGERKPERKEVRRNQKKEDYWKLH